MSLSTTAYSQVSAVRSRKVRSADGFRLSLGLEICARTIPIDVRPAPFRWYLLTVRNPFSGPLLKGSLSLTLRLTISVVHV